MVSRAGQGPSVRQLDGAHLRCWRCEPSERDRPQTLAGPHPLPCLDLLDGLGAVLGFHHRPGDEAEVVVAFDGPVLALGARFGVPHVAGDLFEQPHAGVGDEQVPGGEQRRHGADTVEDAVVGGGDEADAVLMQLQFEGGGGGVGEDPFGLVPVLGEPLLEIV
jgi:hypothetical protein